MTKKEEKSKTSMITVHVMGKKYVVPAGLTIMTAMEYAGYRYVRGAGCRAGFCGACGTIYRKEGDYKLYTALACQSSAEDGMFLSQLPFVPANRATYDLEELKAATTELVTHYPEVARCVSCNTCTKACPQELDVMDFVQTALRGDIEQTARLSFDCIQCGLCAVRCPAEIAHYHVGQLARRLYGKYIAPKSKHLSKRVEEIDSGKFDKEFAKLTKMSTKGLTDLYKKRTMEK